jgi:hypothetical protein
MYTLRTIIDGNYQINNNLNNQYSLVSREECTADSENTFAKECYGFVLAEEKKYTLYIKNSLIIS